MYIYICVILHPRCRISILHPAPKPTSPPTILFARPDPTSHLAHGPSTSHVTTHQATTLSTLTCCPNSDSRLDSAAATTTRFQVAHPSRPTTPAHPSAAWIPGGAPEQRREPRRHALPHP